MQKIDWISKLPPFGDHYPFAMHEHKNLLFLVVTKPNDLVKECTWDPFVKSFVDNKGDIVIAKAYHNTFRLKYAKYTFDDQSIGLSKDNKTVITPVIHKPIELDKTTWYLMAFRFCKLLNIEYAKKDD